jgi:ABC-type ATPase involved in cell division
MYQSGALWSSMTLAENIALPLETYTDLSPARIREVVELKLALVGMAGFEEFYPFAIGSNSIFLDAYKRTRTATGNPKKMLAETKDPTLRLFLTRGEKS